MDFTGFRPIGRTAAYVILMDEGDVGLVYHQLFTPGTPTPYVQASIPHLDWMRFYWRTDWPKDTLVFCTDVGVKGSWWRFDGTYWVVDQEFLLGSSQGAINGQALKFSNTLTGFKAFGSFMTPRFFFASPGRRFRMQGRVLRSTGTTNAPVTALTMDSVSLLTFPWDIGANMREQIVDTIVTFPDALNIAAGANPRIASCMNLGQPNVGYDTAAVTTDTAAFPTLENIVHTFSIGISDTGSNGAIYAMQDLRFACLA